ncbi:XAC2610-related protein [Flavobacterium sp. GCM10027622]|uniref:XAC2610-related protein n=1 Tax=unclassified Flavobacterium TaxID=196869 RepID=UPI00360E579E
MKIYFLYSFAMITLVLSCQNKNTSQEKEKQRKQIEAIKADIKKVTTTIPSKDEYTEGTTEIICDTFYPNEGFKIVLRKYDDKGDDETVNNSVFILSKLQNGNYLEIYRDSIFRRFNEIQFKDFNNDGVKDILIENDSDVRSNLTYYLYLVDLKKDKLKKIKGFEEIKNPKNLPEYNLIDSSVMSGRDWTGFYKIQGDSIKEFDDIVYWGQDEEGNPKNPELDYQKTIKKILQQEKNKR